MLFNPIDHLEAIKHGKINEPLAKAKYEKATDVKVYEMGIVVKTSMPWLRASPDGIFYGHDKKPCLLEIKSPFGSVDKEEVEVSYLDTNGNLKPGSSEFMQAQIQMFVCNVEKCHFFIDHPKKPKCIEIHLEKDFC